MNEFFKELGELLEKHAVEIDVREDSFAHALVATGLDFSFMNSGKTVEHNHLNLDVADCQLLAEKE